VCPEGASASVGRRVRLHRTMSGGKSPDAFSAATPKILMGNKDDLDPGQRIAFNPRAWYSYVLRARHVWPWVIAAAATAWSLSFHLYPSHACPPDHLCVPNSVGGSPSLTTPYIEYSEVTSTATVYRVSSLLKTVKTPYQLIQVYETLFFGKLLTIDGALMITERDEPNYHETIVHTVLNYLPNARRVLVVGAGDGGTVTQLVKHPNLEEIVWCEIDEQVIQFAKDYFPRMAKALGDPRVKLRVQNAATYVQEARYPVAGVNNGTFDAILLDTTDFNQAEPLFSATFYQDCKALLSPRGILAFNLDSPQWGQVRVAGGSEQMSRLFRHAYIFQSYQPTYASGHYSFMFASDAVHPFLERPDWNAWNAKAISTRYYNPDVHYASFLLATQLQTVLHGVPRLHQIAPSIFPDYDVPGVVQWPVKAKQPKAAGSSEHTRS
jgi:spermidine synthase